MTELFSQAITIILSAIVGAVASILVSRYSKTKRERSVDLSDKYLRLADMTYDQLEEKINQITKQGHEIDALKATIEAMKIDQGIRESHLTEIIEAMKDYIKVLIDSLRAHNIEIPPRPDILKESNPKITKVTG